MANTTGAVSAIELRWYSQPLFPWAETVEAGGDHFVLSLPLCRGSVKIGCEGGTIYDGDVRPGMLRITAPGERLLVERRSRAEAVVLSIPGPLFRRAAEHGRYRASPSALSHVPPIVDPHPQVERLTTSLLGASEIDPNQRPLFLEGITLALMALALSPRPERRGERGGLGLSAAAFARCTDFADVHLADKVDLNMWAAAVGLPPAEFVRRFQHTAKIAPYSWFLNRRIDTAKRLLLQPEVGLAQVAFRVGFCSQSHFSEAFRRRTGVSPGAWRKRVQGS